MKRDFLDYLADIIEAMKNVNVFIKDLTYNDFINDTKSIYAVTRAIEIIGEASKKIPDNIRSQNPEVPWKEMSGMRDKLIHEYFGVNLRRVWLTATRDVPTILPMIEDLLEDLIDDS